MAGHLIAYERGRDQSALDFTITIGGIVYIGWIGPTCSTCANCLKADGGSCWLCSVYGQRNSGAYSIGRACSKHKIGSSLERRKVGEELYCQRLYQRTHRRLMFGSFKHLETIFLAFGKRGNDRIAVGALAPLGDLGESMIKRQSGIKIRDIIPGAAFDRIDFAGCWGAVIGGLLCLNLVHRL